MADLSEPDPEVVDLIRDSRSLPELEEGLKRVGLHPSPSPKLRRQLLKHWRAANQTAIQKALSEELSDLDHLPATEVVRTGTTFFIHGVVHGQRGSISPEVRTTIGHLSAPFMNVSGQDLLLEYGMDRMFDLPRSQRMETADVLYRGYGLRNGLLIMALVPFLPLISLTAKLARKDHYSRELLASMGDLRKLKCVRALQPLMRELPQPLDLQLRRLEGRFAAFTVERSRDMAKAMVEHARKGAFEAVHALVGLDHESQIAWFLANEDFSLSASGRGTF